MAKILAIDDEEFVRLLIEEDLSDCGYRVVTHDGSTGVLALIEEIRPDLVTIDIKLPRKFPKNDEKEAGLELVQRIRNKYYNLPIIIYTAYDSFRHDKRVLAADWYLVKSFDRDELLRTIKKALAASELDFERLSFGASTAEEDLLSHGLLSYFITTQSFKRVLEGNKVIILGNRGTGKSAILKMIANKLKKTNNIVTELSPEDYSYELFSEAIVPEKSGAWAKQSAYVAAWKYLILIEIMKNLCKHGPKFKSGEAGKVFSYLRNKGLITDLNPISLLISYIKRIEAIKIGKYEAGIKIAELDKLYKLEEIRDFLPAIIEMCRRRRAFVLIDDLDYGWDASEDAKAFVGGLVQAALYINRYSPDLRIIISLRRELFDNIASLYTEAEKHRDLIENLKWNAHTLRELIIRRIKYSVLGLVNADEQKCWNSVFNENSIQRGSNLFEYIIDRTLYRPREIIQFCSKALDEARDYGKISIDLAAIKSAELDYSVERIGDLESEYRFQFPGLKSVFDVFRGKGIEFNYEELMEICIRISIGESHIDISAEWAIDREPEHLIRILWKVGFLQAKTIKRKRYREQEKAEVAYYGSHQISNLNIESERFFRIHPAFWSYLNPQ